MKSEGNCIICCNWYDSKTAVHWCTACFFPQETALNVKMECSPLYEQVAKQFHKQLDKSSPICNVKSYS